MRKTPKVEVVMNGGIDGKDWIGKSVGPYEYLCVTYDDYREALAGEWVTHFEKAGWRKAWADIQMDGAFVVFRRERA